METDQERDNRSHPVSHPSEAHFARAREMREEMNGSTGSDTSPGGDGREPPAAVEYLTSDNHFRPLDEIEADIIRLAIGHYRGRMSEVARRLGMGRSTLYRKLSEMEIDWRS